MRPSPIPTIPLLLLALVPTLCCQQAAAREPVRGAGSALAAGETTPAPRAGASPLLNRYYQDADFERWTDVFERPGREVFDRRFQIIDAAQVREGMRVADIGAGTGFFSALFARAVGPEGVVYAIDTSPDFVAGIEERARTYRVKNLVPIVNTQQGIGLGPGSIDLAFLSDTYHHFEDPQAMLASIHRALAPYGGLIVIDMHRIPGASSPWILDHVRAGRDQVVAEVEAAGFRLVEEPAFLKDNFFLRFERLGDEPDVEAGPTDRGASHGR